MFIRAADTAQRNNSANSDFIGKEWDCQSGAQSLKKYSWTESRYLLEESF